MVDKRGRFALRSVMENPTHVEGMAQPPPDPAAVAHVMRYFGRLGGQARTPAQTAARRANGCAPKRARRGPVECAAFTVAGSGVEIRAVEP